MSKSILELYHLIDSLEKTEKAYYIKFGFKYKKEGTPIYELYNLIDKALKKKKTIINVKLENNIKVAFLKHFPKVSFPSTKLKLLNDLLDALVKYNEQQESVNNLLLLLQKVNILIDKGFYNYAIKQLRINLNNPILEKNEELKSIFLSTLINTLYKNYDVENIITYKQQYFELIEKMNQKTSLSILYDKIYTIHIRYANIEKSQAIKNEINEVQESLNNMSIDGQELKFQFNYYSTLQILSIVQDNYEDAFKYSEKLFFLSKDNKTDLNLIDHQVYGILSNLIIDSLNYGIKEFYIKYIDELKVSKNEKNDIDKYKTYLYLKCVLNYQFLTQNFKKLSFWIDFYEKYDAENYFTSKQNIYLLYDFAIAAYICGNQNLFLNFSNSTLSLSSKSIKVEEIEKTLYFALLTHFFETKDVSLFEYHLNSFESRYCNAGKENGDQLRVVLKLFAILKDALNKNISSKELNELLKKLNVNQLKNPTIGNFDIKLWLEGKLAGKKYSEKIKTQLSNHFKD